MDNNGYIKIYRSLLDWEWWKDNNTFKVFMYLLLNANWKESRYRGYDVPKGGLVVGINSLSETLDISVQSVRTALNHLKSTNEITIKTTNKFSIVSIVNWEKYQGCDDELTNKITSKLTNNQQTTNKQLTTEEEYKNIKKNNIFIRPTLEEVESYCRERKNNVDPESFINFYESKGWFVGKNKMKDWRACVRTWENNGRRRKEEPQAKNYDTEYDFDAMEREYGLK